MTGSSTDAPKLPQGVKPKRGANGKTYYYFEHEDGRRDRIMAEPGEPTWPAALAQAMRKRPSPRTRPNLFKALLHEFERSPEARGCAKATQDYRAVAMRRIEDWFLEYQVRDFNRREIRRDIYALRNSLAKTPRMADAVVETLSRVLSWAYDQGADIEVNHAARISRLAGGHRRSDIVWSDAIRLAFWQRAEPAAARAHQALYYSGARLADAAAWGPEHYDGRWLVFIPQKTRETRIEVHLPAYILSPFQKLLDEGLPLRTMTGKRWVADYLSDTLRDERQRLFGDTLDLHSHDLRGTVSTKLIDAGCTDREVSAITGHVTAEAASERARSLSAYVKRTRQQAINAYTKWYEAEFAPRGEVVPFQQRG